MSSQPPIGPDPREPDAVERFVKEEITRKQAILRFGAGGALLAFPGWLAACGGGGEGGKTQETGPTPSGDVKKGGRFSMARNEEPLSLDPIIPSDNGSIWVIYQIFDQLTTVNEDSSGIAPCGRRPLPGRAEHPLHRRRSASDAVSARCRSSPSPSWPASFPAPSPPWPSPT